MTNAKRDQVRALAQVMLVEEDCIARIPEDWNVTAGVEPKREADMAQLWSLYRGDQCSQLYDETNRYPLMPYSDGSNANVWILDTGVRVSHEQFKGTLGTRAVWYWTAYTENTDNNGHGTHCAGTAGGTSVGFAKNTMIYSNQVLSRTGSGSYANVVTGIEMAVQGAATTPGPDIISMSLGGGVSDILDAAVNAASLGAQRIPVIVAAGNNAGDAAAGSPCRAAEAICVGATDAANAFATYSNRGAKVHVLAPGSNVYSAWYTSDSAYNTISGTSMACPAVAGSLSAYASSQGLNPDVARTILATYSTVGVTSGVPPQTQNRMIYDRFDQTPKNPPNCILA